MENGDVDGSDQDLRSVHCKKGHSVSTQIQIRSKAVTQNGVLKIRVFQMCQRMELSVTSLGGVSSYLGAERSHQDPNIAAMSDG